MNVFMSQKFCIKNLALDENENENENENDSEIENKQKKILMIIYKNELLSI